MRDWSSVPYPPWWVERAARRRAELDAAVARIRTVVDETPTIVGALVFGSYATDRVAPTSDLDVMIVTTEPAGDDWTKRWARIHERLALAVTCDLVVYEPAEFEKVKQERNFVAQAWREGIWIGAATPA